MNGADQFYVFMISVCCGAAGGLLYDALGIVRAPFRVPAVRIVTDILFCAAFAALYLAVCVALSLPDLRFYSFAACVLGFFLYLKSFHKIVAFFGRKIYNKMKQIRRGRSRCPKKEGKALPKKK